MIKVKKTIIGFLVGVAIYAILVEAVGIFFSQDLMAYTLGLLFGTVVAVFLMLHITYTLDKALDLGEQGATKYVRRQTFLRLGVMLLAMVLSLMLQEINFIASILGMLGLKIGSFIAAPVLKRMYPEEFVTKPEDELME